MEAYLAAGFGLLATTLLGLAVALLRKQGETLDSHGRELTRVSTALTGVAGDNGIVSEVKTLRSRAHDLAGDVQAITLRVTVNEQRIARLEESNA
jgi:hypothetical protein